MTTLVRFREPLRNVAMNGEFERLIQTIFESPARATALSNRAWTPPLDIWETEGEFVYAFFHRHTGGENRRRARGQHPHSQRLARAQRAGGWAPLPLRASFGEFTRSVALPEGTDDVEARAHYANGVLEVHVEKREQSSRARSRSRRPSRAVPPTSLHSRDVRREAALKAASPPEKPSYATAFPAAAANDPRKSPECRADLLSEFATGESREGS